MVEKNKKSILEAILFAMGEAVEVERLASVIEEDEAQTRILLNELRSEYDETKRGIALIEIEDSFQMCTQGEMYEYLIRIAKTSRKAILTDTLLETLSIIAYKQPVTRSEIEKIRGVSCDHAVNRLLEFSLIEEKGRLDAPGRPLLFGTTEEFLRGFGIKTLDELPAVDPIRLAEWKIEAEQELKVELDV